MKANVVIRAAISAFIVALLAITLLGWVWVGQHQAAEQALASHAVLGLSAAAGVVGLIALWRGTPA